MSKWRVCFDIDETVEAENREEAVEKAICQYCGIAYFLTNDLTDKMYYDANVWEEEDDDDEAEDEQ